MHLHGTNSVPPRSRSFLMLYPVVLCRAVCTAGGGIGGHFLGSFGNLLMPELGTDDELRPRGAGSAAGSMQLHGTSPSMCPVPFRSTGAELCMNCLTCLTQVCLPDATQSICSVRGCACLWVECCWSLASSQKWLCPQCCSSQPTPLLLLCHCSLPSLPVLLLSRRPWPCT